MGSRPTVAAIRANKGISQILTMHVDTISEAEAAAEAGIQMFTTEIDAKLGRLRVAAPGVFIQAGAPQGVMSGPETAIREAFKAMEVGADAIYFAGGLNIVEAMAREGIPVTGHVGFVPRWQTWTGVRAIGKTAEEALKLFRKVKDLESAGGWAVEMELVPVEVADFVTRNTSLITEGMGCGKVCDTQYLFSCDVLGTNTGRYPRHSKKYVDLAAEENRLQMLRVQAFKAYAKDVETKVFPARGNEIHVTADVTEALTQAFGQK